MSEDENVKVEASLVPEDDAPVAFTCGHLTLTELPAQVTHGPAFSKTFHAHYTDPDTGVVYTGEFTCKRLNIGSTLDHGVIKTRLCAGMQLLDGFEVIASWLAYLEVALTKKPEWWAPLTSYDKEALHAMHDYVRVWENSFRRKRVGQRRG